MGIFEGWILGNIIMENFSIYSWLYYGANLMFLLERIFHNNETKLQIKFKMIMFWIMKIPLILDYIFNGLNYGVVNNSAHFAVIKMLYFITVFNLSNSEVQDIFPGNGNLIVVTKSISLHRYLICRKILWASIFAYNY